MKTSTTGEEQDDQMVTEGRKGEKEGGGGGRVAGMGRDPAFITSRKKLAERNVRIAVVCGSELSLCGD